MNDAVKAHAAATQPDWTLETDLRCTHDLEGRLVSISAAAAQMLGFKREELLGVPLRDLLTAEYRDQFQSYLDTIRTDGAASGLMSSTAVRSARLRIA